MKSSSPPNASPKVRKRPQGILYGRNATGGAVNNIPTRPGLGKIGGGFNVSFGNYDAVNVDGYVNLATSDNSALRVAATRQVRRSRVSMWTRLSRRRRPRR
jgi:iron complex outermembrane receptor protein